jgi:hypothetical protein
MGRCHGMIKHERSDLTTIKVSLFLECTAGSGFFFLVLLPKITIQFFYNNQSRGCKTSRVGKKLYTKGSKSWVKRILLGRKSR